MLDILGKLLVYVSAALTIIGVSALYVLIEIEKYKEENKGK